MVPNSDSNFSELKIPNQMLDQINSVTNSEQIGQTNLENQESFAFIDSDSDIEEL